MSGECRFDPHTIDVPFTRGETRSFQYSCLACGQWHWCIPEFEVDGTTATAAEARTAIEDTLDAYYRNTYGQTWREAHAAGLAPAIERPEWTPNP